MHEQTEDRLIATVPKNTRQQIRLRLTTFNGRDLVDVRTYYRDGEEWLPGKGLAFGRELACQVFDALRQVLDELPEELRGEPAEKPKRRRRTKAEMAADRAAE